MHSIHSVECIRPFFVQKWNMFIPFKSFTIGDSWNFFFLCLLSSSSSSRITSTRLLLLLLLYSFTSSLAWIVLNKTGWFVVLNGSRCSLDIAEKNGGVVGYSIIFVNCNCLEDVRVRVRRPDFSSRSRMGRAHSWMGRQVTGKMGRGGSRRPRFVPDSSQNPVHPACSNPP